IWKTGKREFSTSEIVREVGKRLDDESSITYWAARNNIPVYLPGPTDGAFGSQLWMWRQTHPDLRLDLFKDEQELSDIVFDAEETGALMIGGGISKHHVIWWNQFRDGLDRAVYITTAVEWDGSLSGARMKEAISWGKLKEGAPHVTVEGDATVLLPLLMASIRQQLDGARK
ncbi:MAG: deoxyhypusine synthase family protein, partial [Candidatus Thermoplasmatota archaeon]|nr:deoxyhypusine synthase family protein [Candidatus Thermoplasmatota archaeon]